MRKTVLLMAILALIAGICSASRYYNYPPFYNNYQPRPYYNRNYVQRQQYQYRRQQRPYRRPYYPRYYYDDDDDDDWDDRNGYDTD